MPKKPKSKSTSVKSEFVHPLADPNLVATLLKFLAGGFSAIGSASRGVGPALRSLRSALRWFLLERNEPPIKGELSEAVSNLPRVQVRGSSPWSREGFAQLIAYNLKAVEATRDPKVIEKVHNKFRSLHE